MPTFDLSNVAVVEMLEDHTVLLHFPNGDILKIIVPTGYHTVIKGIPDDARLFIESN